MELQLIKCLKFWYNELNNKKCVDIIYIDFAKLLMLFLMKNSYIN